MNTEKLPIKTQILAVSKKVGVGIAGLVILLYFAVWIFSPMVARWQLNKLLNPVNLQLTEDATIRLNPFLLKVSISDILLQRLETGQAVASLNHAVVNVNAFGLFFNELELEELAFNDIDILALKDESMVEIAGFVLQTPNQTPSGESIVESESSATTENNPARVQDAHENKPWQVLAQTINLNDLAISFTNHGYEHQVVLKTLALDNITMSASQQVITLRLQALLDEAPLSVNFQMNNQSTEGQLSLDLQLQAFALARIAYLAKNYLDDLSGNLSLDFSQRLSFQGAEVKIDMPHLNLELESLSFFQQKNQLTNENFRLSFSDALIESTPDSGPIIKSKFSLSNHHLSIINEQKDKLLQLGNLTLNAGQLNLVDLQDPAATIDSVLLSDIMLSQQRDNNQSEDSAQSKLPPIAAIKQLTLNQLELAQQHLSIMGIKFERLEAAVILDKDKKLANLVALSSAQQDEAANAQEPIIQETQPSEEQLTSQSNSPSPFTFNLGELVMSPDSRLSFIDQSVSPAFEQSLEMVEFKISNLDNRQSDRPTDFNFILKTDAYAQTNISGNLLPFSEKMNLDIAANIKEYSLPKISPYLKDAMGFEMLSGQFDTDTKVTIKDDEIDGKARLFMRGLELSSTDDVDERSLKDQSAMPLNSALSMLMDDKGNLELEIPLSGDVSEPDFGVAGFVALVSQKAIMAAAQSYLIESFVPYANVLSVVMMAGEAMLKVNIEDLVYPPTVIDVQPQHQIFIEEFAALLKDKPDTQVKVCAIAVPADLTDKNLATTDPQFKQQLNLISQKRGEAFKAWLVEKAQIESARMLLCQPRIDRKAGANPRIEFEL